MDLEEGYLDICHRGWNGCSCPAEAIGRWTLASMAALQQSPSKSRAFNSRDRFLAARDHGIFGRKIFSCCVFCLPRGKSQLDKLNQSRCFLS
jgi:hypothetical protein